MDHKSLCVKLKPTKVVLGAPHAGSQDDVTAPVNEHAYQPFKLPPSATKERIKYLESKGVTPFVCTLCNIVLGNAQALGGHCSNSAQHRQRLRDLSPHEKQAFLQTSMCTCLSEKFLPCQPSPPSTSSFQPLLPLLNSIFTPLILVLQTTRHCFFLFPDTLTVQKKRRQALASSWNPRQWPLRRLHDVCTNRKTKRKCLYRVAKHVSSLSYRSFPANGD